MATVGCLAVGRRRLVLVVSCDTIRREMALYPDSSLAGQFLRGDSGAHGQVVRWLAAVLTGPRFRVLRPDWQDLLQECLKRVLESLRSGRFDPDLSFKAYVQSIARYTAREHVAKTHRMYTDPLIGDAEDLSVPAVDERIAGQQLATAALALVGPECRLIFDRFFYAGWSYARIAEELGIPLGTMKSRMFRCLRKAREELCRKVSPQRLA